MTATRTWSTATGFSAFVQALAAAPELDPELAQRHRLLEAGGVVVGDAYEIQDCLGRGGLGTVYRARDLELGRAVAVKLLRVEWLAAEQRGVLPGLLEREARATAVLNHPNIVTVHRYGMWEGLPFVVLELLAGESLAAKLARGALPRAEALRYTDQILAGLEHAHAHGVVHRDLAPGNVFVRHDGVVKILDFGMATLRAGMTGRALPGHTLVGAGTPGFMSPEQERGEVPDERADLWAVGALLACMLGGRRGKLPADVAGFAARACAAAPEARFPDAAAMRAALAARGRWSRRRWLAFAGAALAVAAAAGLAAAHSLADPAVSSHVHDPELLAPTRSPFARLVPLDQGPALEGSWIDEAHSEDNDSRVELIRRSDDSYQVLVGRVPREQPLTAAQAMAVGSARLYRIGGMLYLEIHDSRDLRGPGRDVMTECRVDGPDSLVAELSLERFVGKRIDTVNTRAYHWTRWHPEARGNAR